MIAALSKLLQRHQGKDVKAFRRGPFALYLWDAETEQHVRYDPFYKPEAPDRRSYDPKGYKQALDRRSLFLSRRAQAVRESF